MKSYIDWYRDRLNGKRKFTNHTGQVKIESVVFTSACNYSTFRRKYIIKSACRPCLNTRVLRVINTYLIKIRLKMLSTNVKIMSRIKKHVKTVFLSISNWVQSYRHCRRTLVLESAFKRVSENILLSGLSRKKYN